MQKTAKLLETKEKSIFVSARSLYRGKKPVASKLPVALGRPADAAHPKTDVNRWGYVAK